jgi:hypothetical protein
MTLALRRVVNKQANNGLNPTAILLFTEYRSCEKALHCDS